MSAFVVHVFLTQQIQTGYTPETKMLNP